MQSRIPPPPKTSTEWLKKNNYIDWPVQVDEQELGNIGWEYTSKEAIAADLRRHAPLDIKILEEVEAELLQLEERLGMYANSFFEDRQRDRSLSKTAEGLRFAPHPASLTKLYDHDVVAAYMNIKPKQKDKSGSDDKTKSTKNDPTFPGFSMDELTPLPSQLEALQILLKPGFTKLWKKVFLSQASVAILQDAFWWFCLDHYQPDNVEAKSQLFARTGDSYVALFCSISLDFKDKFFRFYADCLAQAIFTTFCQAYPALRKTFHDETFKTQLVNVVWEWIAGIRPPAGAWHRWKMNELDPDYILAPIETDESPTHAHKRASKIAFNLADMEAALPGSRRSMSPSVYAGGRGSLKPRQSSLSPIKFQSRNMSPLSSRFPEEESEQVGRGPDFERVLFDTKGHSPLVSHYLQSRHLLTEGPGPTDYMKRTQLSALPPPAPTYREVIRHARKVNKKMTAEYERDQHEFMMEEQRARKQNRKLRQEFQRLTNEILSRQHEVKMLSDRLIDSLVSGSYMPIGTLMASVLNPLDASEFSESETNMSVSSDHQETRKSVTPENRPTSSQSPRSRQTPQ